MNDKTGNDQQETNLINTGLNESQSLTNPSELEIDSVNLEFDKEANQKKRDRLASLQRIVIRANGKPNKPKVAILDLEILKAIRSKGSYQLQNAIDLAYLTAQRPSDILSIRFDEIQDGYLIINPAKRNDISFKFKLDDQFNKLIERCHLNNDTDYLINIGFSKIRDEASYKDSYQRSNRLNTAFANTQKKIDNPRIRRISFYEIRELSIRQYEKLGIDMLQHLFGKDDIYTSKHLKPTIKGRKSIEVNTVLDLSKIL